MSTNKEINVKEKINVEEKVEEFKGIIYLLLFSAIFAWGGYTFCKDNNYNVIKGIAFGVVFPVGLALLGDLKNGGFWKFIYSVIYLFMIEYLYPFIEIIAIIVLVLIIFIFIRLFRVIMNDDITKNSNKNTKDMISKHATQKKTENIFAKLYTDGTLILSSYDYTDASREVKKDYKTVDGLVYWENNKYYIKNVVIFDKIKFKNCMRKWFNDLKNVTTIDLKNLDVSEAFDLSNLFCGCSSLVELDISSFNTAKVTDMNSMFKGCSNLKKLNLSSFNTFNVTNMSGMFCDCTALEEINISNFDTSNVTKMSKMFYNCTNLKEINLSNFDTFKVIDMSEMFCSCTNLKEIKLSNFDTSNVVDMSQMFLGCSGLTELNLESFNTSRVTNMSRMFSFCKNLKELNMSSFNTSKVTDMSKMFWNCKNLKELNLENFNTSKVTDMNRMFQNCESLEKLDLISFNTANVCDMERMFYNCSNMKSLDVLSFSTLKTTDMSSMFKKCEKLKEIDLSSFEIQGEVVMNQMFEGCTSLKEIKTNSYKINQIFRLEARDLNDRNVFDENMSGLDFERFCKEILKRNGFNNVEVTLASGDYGTDIIAEKDGVKYAIQCKKYSESVGVKAVQEVIASRSIYNCHVAVVLTNSRFTPQAINLAQKNNVLLWDKEELDKMIRNSYY